MGSHPVNLAFRFLLELAALGAAGYWGYFRFGWWAALVFPVALAFLWGTFAVPGDPSRSGKAPVKTPGAIRLLLELGIFFLAAWMLWDAGKPGSGIGLLLAVLLHYGLSLDRIRWLLAR